MSDRPSLEESARLLRQRLEMGAGEIFLDGLTREEALGLIAQARSAAPLEAAAALEAAVPSATRAAAAPQPRSAHVAPAQAANAVSDPPREGVEERPRAAEAPGRSQEPPEAHPSEDASEATADPALPDDYDALREIALACTRCGLSKGRTQVVFSDGPRAARLMVVGEAPGANEDQTGVPFVGAAGQYLDLLLATVGLSREENVYIANVLKCRPPGNRDPKPDEIETCSPFLRKQIDLVRPKALLAVGSFSGKLLTGRDKVSLGKLRGEVHSYHGVPLVVTYHPAALLRNPRWVRPFWDDLQLLRGVLARGGEVS